MGVQIPPWEGAIMRGKGRPIVKYRHSVVSLAKQAEPIEMPFGLWTQMGPRWGSIGAEGRCHGNQFLAFDGL